ncbi:protease modulator HflC [Polaribacter glomeratus]|uniref:Protein HflC n=1 Tax=Polaribacter glomeratus TaxID=102 RepID=A0A2S7WF62_9FLAO|nr:protease modulator HflC [Polaribacter glomeratus]PQJ76268.1 HflC protein [Polaribacter glomeratus]TXD63816.1 protease modulator HflC [Polaribacter glomeratus]
MKTKSILIIILVIITLIGLNSSVFVVEEKDQVVITQFGKPVGEAIIEPGMFFKLPFIQDANYFEKRYMEWNGDPNQVPTKDKKFIFVDTYARWQITDPLQFFKRLTNERGAQSRIDDILDGDTRNFIANNDIEEAVRTSNRIPESSDTGIIGDSLAKIYVGRDSIQNMILESANKQTKELGIKILDFRFKRINYVQEVQDQVYERMKSERFRIADKFRSEGQGEASRINGEKERELKNIQSLAFRDAEMIKGKADATAAAIYADAYNRSSKSRGLYGFLKSMETFEKTFDRKTSIFISTDSELYKYLKKMD